MILNANSGAVFYIEVLNVNANTSPLVYSIFFFLTARQQNLPTKDRGRSRDT